MSARGRIRAWLRAPLAPAGTPDGYRMTMGYRLTTVRPPSAN